jgi:hypothetical protein
MPRKKLMYGPIGNGWVQEVRTEDGIKFVARWQLWVSQIRHRSAYWLRQTYGWDEERHG